MDGLVGQFEHWGDKALHTRALAYVVNIGVLLLVTISAAQWGWGFYLRSLTANLATVSSTLPAQPTQPSELDRLITIELFGHAKTAADDNAVVPISSLNIVLRGVVAAGGESLALISVDGQEVLPYSIGQEISQGAILDAVQADRIIILRQGIRESVMLQEVSPAVSLGPIAIKPSAAPQTKTILQIKPNQYAVNRSFVRQQLQSPKLLTQALILPNAGGGFIFRAVSSDSVYADAGLKSGDIIKRVNGQPINTIDQAMKLYRKLGGIDRISMVNIDIERNGRTQRIQYRVQ
ncbi:MAG: type II secretion system protein N [Acidiferrobacterales bacterium]